MKGNSVMCREILSNNKNWMFSLNDNADKGEYVCLPHCVKLSPANSSGGRNYQGVCKYEKKLFIESFHKEHKVFLEFEGAMGVTELYVNNKKVKTHYCGYTPLVADVTDFINFGEDNVIKLILDNRDNDNVPPGKPQYLLDFSYDGGLYRDARIIYTAKTYITNAILANEAAGGGIFAYFDNIKEKSAVLNVKTHIKNENNACTVSVIQRLFDHKKVCVAEANDRITVASGESEYVLQSAILNNPHLWSVESPYVYNLETSVEIDGNIIDILNTEVGIRTFVFTKNNGVVYNGINKRFSGANYHQTYPYIGNAVPNSLLMRDILKLKSCGMEHLRSHYPFSSAFLSMLNNIGMTLTVSNVGWQFMKDGIFTERMIQNMRDIVRWQRNNPCILLWEPILNESKISFEMQKRLNDVVKEEYPYKPCYTASDYGPTDVAYRDYDPGMLGTDREEYGLIDYDNSDCPRWVREYGDAPDNFYDQNAAWRIPRGWGDYPMVLSVERMIGRFDKTEGTYTKVYNRKDLCGYGVWPGIEHNRGYHINPCWGGYFDLFRIPKFSCWFMKSQLDADLHGDVLFIANYWSEVSPGDITVYSNADKVRLYHDDLLVAEQLPDDVEVKHPPFTFKDVRKNFKDRERSVLRAEAIRNGKVVKTVEVKSPGVPIKLMLEADLMNIPLKADGADIVCIHCYVSDEDGTVVPWQGDNHPILFEVSGEGEIIGDSTIGANPVRAEGGIASILVKSTQKPGNITVTAKILWEQCEPIKIRDSKLIITSVK